MKFTAEWCLTPEDIIPVTERGAGHGDGYGTADHLGNGDGIRHHNQRTSFGNGCGYDDGSSESMGYYLRDPKDPKDPDHGDGASDEFPWPRKVATCKDWWP
jgi:hypothetical protein